MIKDFLRVAVQCSADCHFCWFVIFSARRMSKAFYSVSVVFDIVLAAERQFAESIPKVWSYGPTL